MSKARIIRGRFAPTPSGRMHLGNLFAALLTWLDIRAQGGELLLRMEDLDPDRCRPEYAVLLAEDLRWLGLSWDLGWQPGDTRYQQSARSGCYEAVFEKLREQGLLYPCYCNRRERMAANAPHASDGSTLYSGRCRSLTEAARRELEAAGRRPAWRIRVPHEKISFTDGNFGPYSEWLDEGCGDFILRRSDGVYAYQLAVVADDGLMGVSRVVRGRDLLESTPRQIWLMKRLGFDPPDYCHAPLLLGEPGRRLSKRERDLDMGVLKSRMTPEKLVGYLSYLGGLIDRPEAVRASDLVENFSWARVSTGDRLVGGHLPEF